MRKLKEGLPVTTGAIYKLEPYLGEDGLMRAGGRLDPDHKNHKNPILPSTDNVVTEFIVREVHSTKVGHSGREHTLVALREMFWVPKGRKIIDRVLKRCVIYRKCNWKPTEQ